MSDLAKSASQKIVFLCGSVANDAKVWTFFDKVFCLYVDNKTLEQRLINRLDKDFGKAKHERERVIKLNRDAQNKYKTLGAVIINNTQPTSTVAEEILAKS